MGIVVMNATVIYMEADMGIAGTEEGQSPYAVSA